MSRTALALIFATLGALLVAYGAVRWSAGGASRVPSGIDVGRAIDAEVSLMRAAGPAPGDTVRLERRGETWTVNGYPADTSLVAEALTALEATRASRLVARSAANHGRLGVADGDGRIVTIGPTEAPFLSLIVGGTGPEGRYVRVPEAHEVYVIESEAVGWADRGADDWRDRLIAAADTAAVGEIALRRDGRELLLRRAVGPDSVGRWGLDGRTADSVSVVRLLEAVAELRAAGFPTDSQALAADFDRPYASLELYDEGGRTAGAAPLLSLLFVRLEEGRDYLVRRGDRLLMYRLPAWTTERLLPTREALLGDES